MANNLTRTSEFKSFDPLGVQHSLLLWKRTSPYLLAKEVSMDPNSDWAEMKWLLEAPAWLGLVTEKWWCALWRATRLPKLRSFDTKVQVKAACAVRCFSSIPSPNMTFGENLEKIFRFLGSCPHVTAACHACLALSLQGFPTRNTRLRLYIGGFPNQGKSDIRKVLTQQAGNGAEVGFIGCIKSLVINKQVIDLRQHPYTGDVFEGAGISELKFPDWRPKEMIERAFHEKVLKDFIYSSTSVSHPLQRPLKGVRKSGWCEGVVAVGRWPLTVIKYSRTCI